MTHSPIETIFWFPRRIQKFNLVYNEVEQLCNPNVNQCNSNSDFLSIIQILFFNNLFIFLFIFKLNLLGWHWFTKPCRCQVYNSTRHHLHTALCFQYPKQSLFLSLLPTSPFPSPLSLCLSSHCCLCIYIMLYLLNPFTFSHPVPTPLPSDSLSPDILDISSKMRQL